MSDFTKATWVIHWPLTTVTCQDEQYIASLTDWVWDSGATRLLPSFRLHYHQQQQHANSLHTTGRRLLVPGDMTGSRVSSFFVPVPVSRHLFHKYCASLIAVGLPPPVSPFLVTLWCKNTRILIVITYCHYKLLLAFILEGYHLYSRAGNFSHNSSLPWACDIDLRTWPVDSVKMNCRARFTRIVSFKRLLPKNTDTHTVPTAVRGPPVRWSVIFYAKMNFGRDLVRTSESDQLRTAGGLNAAEFGMRSPYKRRSLTAAYKRSTKQTERATAAEY